MKQWIYHPDSPAKIINTWERKHYPEWDDKPFVGREVSYESPKVVVLSVPATPINDGKTRQTPENIKRKRLITLVKQVGKPGSDALAEIVSNYTEQEIRQWQ